MPKLCYAMLLCSMLFAGLAAAQTNYFGTLSHLKTRPLAMGGAFTSVEDDLAAVLFNPGNFRLYNNKDFGITFFFNPLAAFMASQHYSDNFDKKISNENVLNSSALLLKGIVFTLKFVQCGFILNEESFAHIRTYPNIKFFQFNDVLKHSAHTFFACLQLAERVSLGCSSTYYNEKIDNRMNRGFGFSYGIMLKPATNLNVGLSYIDFPERLTGYRSPLERIEDETMNIGVSYTPFRNTIFSVDVRNLTEDNKENVREVHIGLEQSIDNALAIRLGYFQEKFLPPRRIYSCGIGLFDANLFRKKQHHFDHHHFIMNYTFLYQETAMKKPNHWHLFSLLIPL